MGEYFIGSDGELYHWGWKKKDAKYIKRERKNGKWVYTYPEDKKKLDKTAANDNKNAVYNRGKLDKFIDNAKSALKTYSDGRKKDWEESKVRGFEKAKQEATEDDGKIIYDKDGVRKREKTTFNEGKYLLTTSTIIQTSDNKEYRDIKRGKIDRFIDTAKEYVKDRLGYDERDAMKSAITKYDYAKKAEKNYRDEAEVTKSFMGTFNPRTGSMEYTNDQKKQIEQMERTERMLGKMTDDAEKKASDAADAYFNTTLGKLERARKSGEEWLDELFNDRKKKRK